MNRCKWCNLENKKYIDYHDNEWGIINNNDKYLLEMLILESFQAGLSWECILNKRDNFNQAYDNFDLDKICQYDENKIQELLQNKGIIRNNPKKKDDLKKYKEGYFNEIIQNANDIVLYSGIENPTIEIECKKADNIYEIICSYPDKGFSLKDIYGFCSRGNSNKSSESGQEGMYGIGIKSLFCFAT